MASEKKKGERWAGRIHLHPKANTNGFKQNPQNAGRKKGAYAEHLAELREKGFKPPTKSEYYEMIGMLMSMDEATMKDFAQNKDRPFWIQRIILDLNNKSVRYKVMSDYRDWMFGKAENRVDMGGVTFEIKPKNRTGGKDDRG